MKKTFTLTAFALCCMFGASAASPKVSNDTTLVLKVSPIMHCENCEKKIKNNVRFVKGVKNIETDRTNQTVTIKADKTKLDRISLDKAFKKIGFTIK